MKRYIDKNALVAEIERLSDIISQGMFTDESRLGIEYFKERVLSFLDTLEVIGPYEQCIQYSSIEDGIKAHAETYSFNIESELFNQLTKEQQKLWRKEIEQACISGGEMGIELARDIRYKENVEVKEVDDELQGTEKEVAEGFVERINKKRVPISLKGEMKAKFKNEFNTMWQVIDGLEFAKVAKHIVERLCLEFATWGAYNLKGIGEIKNFDTLEVKEVDLDTDFGVSWGEYCDCGGNINDYEVAKHFFELGLKAQKGE